MPAYSPGIGKRWQFMGYREGVSQGWQPVPDTLSDEDWWAQNRNPGNLRDKPDADTIAAQRTANRALLEADQQAAKDAQQAALDMAAANLPQPPPEVPKAIDTYNSKGKLNGWATWTKEGKKIKI